MRKMLKAVVPAVFFIAGIAQAQEARMFPSRPLQGEAMRVEFPTALISDSEECAVSYGELILPIWNYNGRMISVLPIGNETATGRDKLILLKRVRDALARRYYYFEVRQRPRSRRGFCSQISTRDDPGLRARIEHEESRYSGMLSHNSYLRYASRVFLPPLKRMRAQSSFGAQNVCHGVSGNTHYGVEFFSRAGEEVRSPASALVAMARYYVTLGNFVILDHGSGIKTTYLHLSQLDVREGSVVSDGQAIGKVGATGDAASPRLHWAASIYGVPVDPLSLMRALHF